MRIGTTGVYPRVATLVSNMEQKFDMVEAKIRDYAISSIEKLNSAETNMFYKSKLHTKTDFVEENPKNFENLRGKHYQSENLVLNIHPPEEDTAEIEQTLGALAKVEERNNEAFNKNFLNLLHRHEQ